MDDKTLNRQHSNAALTTVRTRCLVTPTLPVSRILKSLGVNGKLFRIHDTVGREAMKQKLPLVRKPSLLPAKGTAKALLVEVREMILKALEDVARTVDATLALHYWEVGRRIRQDILKEKRAEYGAEIVVTLSRQLGWSHFVALVPIDDSLKRDFYAEMCRLERWNVRTLRKKIGGMLFERTALSKKPKKLIRRELAALRKDDRLTPDMVFRDPHFLDFLGLKDSYAEKDIEGAILREIESFILELEKSGIHVAAYWTKVLPRRRLECKLHDAVSVVHARLQAAKDRESID